MQSAARIAPYAQLPTCTHAGYCWQLGVRRQPETGLRAYGQLPICAGGRLDWQLDGSCGRPELRQQRT
jgi:hypothetical protein